MDRRAFLGSAAASLVLPGCTTTTARSSAGAGCLPPVEVAENRVIRTLAGLRPYRASGFGVRAAARGGKRQVHK